MENVSDSVGAYGTCVFCDWDGAALRVRSTRWHTSRLNPGWKTALLGFLIIGLAVCGENVDAVVRAIRYTSDLIGVDHVALGSDFDGAVQMPFDASNLVQSTDALRNAKFTDIEIQKIMGLNVIRLLQQTLPKN